MNYTDLLQFDERIRPSNPNSDLIEFNGKHEWPNAQTFENAFYWLTLQSYRRDASEKDPAIIKAFSDMIQKAITDALAKNDWLAYYQHCHTAYTFLNGLTDVSVYKTELQSISANDLYKKALAQKNETLNKEALSLIHI